MNIVMRYIHRNKNKMKRSVLAFIIITIAVAACAFIGSYGAVKVLAAQTDTDAAVPAGVVEEKKLTINKKTYVFSNSTDGMFRLSFAEGKSYFIGSGEDSDTMITYALIKYGTKFYLVAADDSDDNVEYNGSYTDTSFDMLESKNYNSAKRCVTLSVKNGANVELRQFTFASDYSVSMTGYYKGTYYKAGQPTTGVFTHDGNYEYFVSGKQVVADGWYKYGSASPVTQLTEDDILNSLGTASVKYLQLFEGHVVNTYQGEKCYSYLGTTRTLVCNKAVTIVNIKVLYDKNGNAKAGVRKVGDNVYFYEAGIPVKNVLKQVGDDFYYLGSNGVALKSQWVVTGDYEFYFSSSSKASKVFYSENFSNIDYAGRLYIYTAGKWHSDTTGLYNVNGKYIYFVKGLKYKGTRWYEKTDGVRYYLKNGQATYLVKAVGIRYKCYIASEDGWVPSGTLWLPGFNDLLVHIGDMGYSDIIFYRSTHSVPGYADTYRVYSNGCWVTKTNCVLYVPGGYYYFNKAGRVVRTSGWHTIDQFSSAYVDTNGRVIEYVYYNKSIGYSIYSTGTLLNKHSAGLKRAVINGKAVYYYSAANGRCLKSTSRTVESVEYVFDSYGRCFMIEEASWNYDDWMKRVTRMYLGKTGIYCNVFVANALRYAGSTDPSIDRTLKYTSFAKGGFVINSSNMCSDWALRKVTAMAVLSNGGNWMTSKEYNLTANRENFSYAALKPGDVIVYYTNGEPTHVGIYFGKFRSASELKVYLKKLGILSSVSEKSVRDWGSSSGNKPEYWVLQGGMGSSDEVYISNSAYDLSGQYAKKIIHIR